MPSLWLLLAMCLVLMASARPQPNSYELLRYLQRFGYLDVEKLEADADDAIQKALLELQSFSGLSKTGALDNATVELLGRPRCGDIDREPKFPLRGSQWLPRDGNWTWRVLRYPGECGRESRGRAEDVDLSIERALALWSRAARLTFAPAAPATPAHIEFVWLPPRDGGQWQAPVRARFAPLLGRVLLDEGGWGGGCGDCQPCPGAPSLTAVIAHGVGHALGLPHSHDPASIMSPWLSPPAPRLALAEDDMAAARALYGPPRRGERECRAPAGDVNALLDDGGEALFAFAGDQVYRLNGDGVEPDYPRKLDSMWAGLPAGGVDAAFELSNGVVYLFKGDRYWSYSPGRRLRAGYPRNTTRGFPGAPAAPDAAITWDGRVYFLKGAEKWMWDAQRRQALKVQSAWPGVPASVSAAVAYRENAYFFKGNKYYRWDHKAGKVAQGYPRPVEKDWFC